VGPRQFCSSLRQNCRLGMPQLRNCWNFTPGRRIQVSDARIRRSVALDSLKKRKGLERGTYHTAVLEDGCYLLYRRPREGGAGSFFARPGRPARR
jgi:hypothetical protein